MGERLSKALISRILARLDDEWRRTGEGDYARTPRHRRRKTGSDSPILQALAGALFDKVLSDAPPPKRIEHINEKAIAKVEKSLGMCGKRTRSAM